PTRHEAKTVCARGQRQASACARVRWHAARRVYRDPVCESEPNLSRSGVRSCVQWSRSVPPTSRSAQKIAKKCVVADSRRNEPSRKFLAPILTDTQSTSRRRRVDAL